MYDISDQSSVDSANFDKDFETTFISPSDIVGRFLASIRNSQCLVRNDSSIEYMIDFLRKNIDAKLASFRAANSNFPHSENFELYLLTFLLAILYRALKLARVV